MKYDVVRQKVGVMKSDEECATIIYKLLEQAVEDDDLERFIQLMEECDLDIAYENGILTSLTATHEKFVVYICNKYPEMLEKYGVDFVTAAARVKAKSSVNFLVNHKNVDIGSLVNSDVYDICQELLGTVQEQ